MVEPARGLRMTGFLTILIVCALLLILRLVYWYLADPMRFPVSTIKIAASYQHITRQQLEEVLMQYSHDSFISLPIDALKQSLSSIPWVDSVDVERQWPDTLKISLTEKKPIAIWNNTLVAQDGGLFQVSATDLKKQRQDDTLPHLSGPNEQQRDVLQNFQKLSKLLLAYDLHAVSLALRDNQAWELGLLNGIQLRLGKTDLEKRVIRFCRAYRTVFADKPEQLSSVDLRYTHGMAVKWVTTEKSINGIDQQKVE